MLCSGLQAGRLSCLSQRAGLARPGTPSIGPHPSALGVGSRARHIAHSSPAAAAAAPLPPAPALASTALAYASRTPHPPCLHLLPHCAALNSQDCRLWRAEWERVYGPPGRLQEAAAK